MSCLAKGWPGDSSKGRVEHVCTALACLQEQVDSASTFVDVFKCFEEWVQQKELFTQHNCAILCDG